jgi:hypothetical protein
MNSLSIAKAITRAVLAMLFLAVVGFSLLLAPEITWPHIGFALLKGALTVLFGAVFLLILTDTMVKSIAASAIEARASRREGGFLYHFLKPDPDELKDVEEPAKKPAQPETAT